MSKTCRRKNAQWAITDYVWDYDSNGHFRKIFIEKDSKDYKKIKADFHRDSDKFFSSVPSWFVTLYCEKSFRQKTKQIIIKWTKNPDESGCMIPEFIRDAGWLYY